MVDKSHGEMALKLEPDIPQGDPNGVDTLAVGQSGFVVLHIPERIGETAIDSSQTALIGELFGNRFRCTQVREDRLISA
jgi:hypothetical protein